MVAFIFQDRKIAKIIGYDNKGSILIVRHLDQGRFERLSGATTGPAVEKVTAQNARCVKVPFSLYVSALMKN